MNSILITGCNRGLGLGLVKQILALAEQPKHIFATCRNIDQAQELRSIAEQHSNVHILQLDLNDFNSYDNVVSQVDAVVQENGLNVLFNNAGVASKSTRLGLAKAEDLIDCFRINTVAPVMLTKAFLPLLKRAAQLNSKNPMGVTKAAVLNMSSEEGSIELNYGTGYFAYRISKAGLNSASKNMSMELESDGILCVSIHPGWVRTDMGGPCAPLDVETSCRAVCKLMMKLNKSHNGYSTQYDGERLPW